MNEPKFKVGDVVYCFVENYENYPKTYGIALNKIIEVDDMQAYMPETPQHYIMDEEDEEGNLIIFTESDLSFDKQPLIDRIVELLKK